MNKHVTRTYETEEAYQTRARQLVKRFKLQTGKTWFQDPLAWVLWLDELRCQLKKNSWRQYKAACVSLLEKYESRDLVFLKAKIELLNLSQNNCKKRSKKTSSRRLKKLSKHDLREIYNELKPRENERDEMLIIWLAAGILTGLRPHEWWQARLENETLIVRNAKATNGRANGAERFLDLSNMDDNEHYFIQRMMSLVLKRPDYDSTYLSVSRRLRKITKKLWPHRKKRPALYSARHQFRANAASAGISLMTQGALMGHASAETARRHYGHKRFGSGNFRITPAMGTQYPQPICDPFRTQPK